MQFALLIYHSPEEFAMRSNDYDDPHLGAWRAYYKALVEAGVYVGANAIEVPETGTTVRLKEGKRRVQDGPYADTKEQLGGLIILPGRRDLKWMERITPVVLRKQTQMRDLRIEHAIPGICSRSLGQQIQDAPNTEVSWMLLLRFLLQLRDTKRLLHDLPIITLTNG